MTNAPQPVRMEARSEPMESEEVNGGLHYIVADTDSTKVRSNTPPGTSAMDGVLQSEPATVAEGLTQIAEQQDGTENMAETAPMAGVGMEVLLQESVGAGASPTGALSNTDVMDVSTATAESGVARNVDADTLGTTESFPQDFADAAAQQKDDPQAEWQLNSSDEEDSDLSSDSDESESDSDDEYALLDPATAARMLMAGDGDDEDGQEKKARDIGGDRQPRTANEVKEEVIPRPDINITSDMQITALGMIERIVENTILVKGHTSGEYQVLEPGSVLCNADRKVVGVVSDLFGRVQEPMYSVSFNTAEEELVQELELGVGSELFYVDELAKFVFTKPLRSMKGTDASNIHDEEVAEDDLAFSDDEEEAEFKRQKKRANNAGRFDYSRSAFNNGERIEGRPGSRDKQRTDHRAGSSHNQRADRGPDSSYSNSSGYIRSSDAPSSNYGGGMNYDDDVTDGYYQPLRRPDNLSQMMMAPPGRRDDFMRGRGRGRGDRGRGRGDRGRGRGNQQGHGDRDRSQTRPAYTPPATAVAVATGHQAYATAPSQYSQSQQTYQFNGYVFPYGTGQTQQSQYPTSTQTQYQQTPATAAYGHQYAPTASASPYQQTSTTAPYGYQQGPASPAYGYQQASTTTAYGYHQTPTTTAYASPAYYAGHYQAGYPEHSSTYPAQHQQHPYTQAPPQPAAYTQTANATTAYTQGPLQSAAYAEASQTPANAQGQPQSVAHAQIQPPLTTAQQQNLADVLRRLGTQPPQN